MSSPLNAPKWAFACFVILLSLGLSSAQAQTGPPNEHFRVDQFGHRPSAPKVAVLRSPIIGFDAPAPWAPAASVTVRRVADDSVAFSAGATPWRAGATHEQSGDRAWLFDFSALPEEGSFHVHDEASGLSSGAFEIGPDPHAEVLREALRSLLYQRCGTPKLAEHAGADWADVACHLGAEQDLDCRPVRDPAAPESTSPAAGTTPATTTST